jgi:hypothetical protein
MIPVVEQVLNGVQFGVMLFLMAAGLTVIFVYVAASFFAATGSFLVGLEHRAGTWRDRLVIAHSLPGRSRTPSCRPACS